MNNCNLFGSEFPCSSAVPVDPTFRGGDELEFRDVILWADMTKDTPIEYTIEFERTYLPETSPATLIPCSDTTALVYKTFAVDRYD